MHEKGAVAQLRKSSGGFAGAVAIASAKATFGEKDEVKKDSLGDNVTMLEVCLGVCAGPAMGTSIKINAASAAIAKIFL
jgi:hypothetical protein